MSSNNRASLFNNESIEDQYKVGYLKQPSTQAHIHTHFENHNLTWYQQIWSCKDMLYDPHWELKNIAVSAFKGSILGCLGFGFSLYFTRKIPAYTLQKLWNYTSSTPFGSGIAMTRMYTPAIVTGAGLGAGWYIWYNLMWTHNSNKSAFTDNLLGCALYGTLVASLLFGPKNYYQGFFGGALVGFLRYSYQNSNHFASRGSKGFYIPLGNLTEEQRQFQANKDFIANLSQDPNIKYERLKEL